MKFVPRVLISATFSATVIVANTASAESFDLEKLIEAAKQEDPITVYAVTGKIVDTAAAFTERYGVQANGKKVKEAAQIELMIREHQAGNITGDLAIAGDVGAIVAQLIPEGIASTWLPPDMADGIPEGQRDPLVVVSDPKLWSYSTEVYDECPVKNVWELTEDQWHGKLAMLDPLVKPQYADWWNQLETHYDDAMAEAYKAHFGTEIDRSTDSATKQWVVAIAESDLLIGDSGTVASAVGAVGQSDPFFGLMSPAKYRKNTKGETALGICSGVAPFSGWMYPGLAMIATKTASPNASRLFTRYLLTEEGISPQTVDGKVSSHSGVPANPKEISGVAAYMKELMVYQLSTAADDFDKRQDWQDLWRIHTSR